MKRFTLPAGLGAVLLLSVAVGLGPMPSADDDGPTPAPPTSSSSSTSSSSPPTSTTALEAAACDEACQLDTWQLAVWQAAVWEVTTTELEAQAAADELEHDEGHGEVSDAPAGADNPCPADIVALIYEVWAGTGLEAWATGIAWRESNCRPEVIGSAGDKGLFQLLNKAELIAEASAALGGGTWADPRVNALAARWLVERSGTCHWEPPDYC